jgi:hypothetical protein
MSNGKLQAKQETLKSLHCPSPQSSLFSSRGTSLNTQHSRESATRCPQHKDALATGSPQQLFIDVSTELLRQGQSVRFRAPGLSMHPAIKEGEAITVAPIVPFDIKRGDILLYIVERKVIAHRVVRIEKKKSDTSNQSSTQCPAQSSTQSSKPSSHLFLLRGDASPICDDPVEAQQILGKVVSVERHGRNIDLHSRRAGMLHIAYTWAFHLKRLILCLLRKWGQIFIFNKKHWGDLL